MQITMIPTSLKSMFLTSNTKENQVKVMTYITFQVIDDMQADGLLDMLQEIGEKECDESISELSSILVNRMIHQLHTEGYSTCFD